MSNECLTWAWAQRLPKDDPARERVNTSTAKFVLVCLADQANADGICWPGQESIGLRVDRDPRTVREALVWLRELGLLSWVYRHDPVTKKARSTVYRLHLGVQLGNVRSGQSAQEATGQSARSVEHDPPGDSADEPPGNLPAYEPSGVKQPSDIEPPRRDVAALVHRMSQRLTANGVKHNPKVKAWQDAARLLLDSDRRDLADALDLIDWATSHEFWRANVLGLPSFRAKFDQLRMQRDRGNGTRRPSRGAQIIAEAMAAGADVSGGGLPLAPGGRGA